MRRRTAVLLATLLPILLLGLAGAGAALAGGGCHGGDGVAPSEASSNVVKIDGCTYAPTVSRVPVGTEVQFINTSNGPHDVTGRFQDWASGVLEAGAVFRHRFAAAGIYPYSCSLHPGMAGVVAVGGVAGSNGVGLASSVQPVADVSVPGEDTPLRTAAAGVVGLLVGAFGSFVVVRRRTAVD